MGLMVSVVFILTASYIRNCRRPTNFPPGPWTLPVVGNMHNLDHHRMHLNLMRLAERYGDVFSLQLGQEWMVVLNGPAILKEALVNQGDSVADRPKLQLNMDASHGLGLGFSSGHLWKQQRQFAISTLRYFGSGSKSLEPVILQEYTHCAKRFRDFKGKPFAPHLMFYNIVTNVICSLVFGHRFEYGDKDFEKLMNSFGSCLRIEASVCAQLYNSFPRLMGCLPGPHQTVKRIYQNIRDFIKEKIKEHKQNLDPSTTGDYIDCYLNKIQKTNLEPNSTFHEENLVVCVWDLFLAGTDTTTCTLRWLFLFMAKYPEMQEKVQAEIDAVIGRSRQASMDDCVNMPYTNAVIHESLRMGNVVPLSLLHATGQELHLRGYTIPKGTTVIANLTSALFDKNEWETPFAFNPGHFLDEEGKFRKRAAFIPFSAGRRVCLGENLARMMLFLFFTSFMQEFSISFPAGVSPVMEYYHFGVTLSPHPYEICAASR
ncbi:unnamed protein product, partial [Tetraodon nigroviridis]